MKRYWFGVIISFFICCVVSAASWVYPVFEKPDFNSRMIGGIPAPFPEELELRYHFSATHPLSYYFKYGRISDFGRFSEKRDQAQIGYVSPELLFVDDAFVDQRFYPAPNQPLWRIGLTGMLGAAMVVLLLRYMRRVREKKLVSGSREEAVMFCLFAVLLRQLLLLTQLIDYNNVIPAAADDPGYFQSMKEMLQGRFDGPWSFTIGNGFFYLPFILLCNASEFYDIALAFDYFSGLVLAPAALAVGFALFRRLGFSNRQALVPILLWAVWPFFYYHTEDWNRELFASFFKWLPAIPWDYYRLVIGSGFNAMSDTPGMLMVLLTFYLLLRLPARWQWAVVLGGVFGFCCLIRINNILFAPALCYLGLRRYEVRFHEWRSVVVPVAAAAGFFAVFGFQLWVNMHQFGNPLTFGYVLHYTDWAEIDRPTAGFTWHTFLKGRNIRQLADANYALWALGITGLLCMKNSYWRTLFALWVVPVIWFFFGYSHTFCDALRFILPTVLPMLAAFAALELWKMSDKRDRFIVMGLIALSLLLVAPSAVWFGIGSFGISVTTGRRIMWLLIAGICVMAMRFWRRGNRNTAVTLGVFLVVYFAGNAYFYAGLLLLILLRGIVDAVREIVQRETTPPSATPPPVKRDEAAVAEAPAAPGMR